MTRQILPLIAAVVLFITACSPKFQATVSEDKPLFSAINTLNKKPGNEKAQNDIRVLFDNTVSRHEEAIAVYKNSTSENRFDKIITELNALQNIYNSVQAVPGASTLVKPKNYLQDLEYAKSDAAEYFYLKGKNLLQEEKRESDLQAYESFKIANRYVSGYKDILQMMDDAYELATINVVINPIEDDNIFFSSYAIDYRYRPQDYEESLVRELGGVNANVVPARFYTERDARRENIEVDWTVDTRWRNIDVSPSVPNRYNREVSKQIQIGKDTAGKAVYQTVRATLQITQRTISVRGGLDYRINDLVKNTTVDQGLLTDYVSWTEAYATYNGDSRALSQEDWALVNGNRNFNRPGKADILNTLMRKIYPNLKYRIQQAAD
jgi:hypothetical protein